MPTPTAVRVRAYRSRLRRCAKLITIEVGGELSLALAEAGFLRDDQTEDTDAIRAAVERLLATIADEGNTVTGSGGSPC